MTDPQPQARGADAGSPDAEPITAVDVRVRPYEPRDRDAIRRLACDTADRGEPVERFFPDRELVAELLTRYYTDYEPGSTWVADVGDQVVGYVTGCLDTRRYQHTMYARIVPRAIYRAVLRGTLLAPETWRLVWASAFTLLRGGLQRRVPLDRYAAHLHINLRNEFRGRRLGARLVHCFLDQAKRAGATGIHVGVRGDNPRACRLFERLGFTVLQRCPVLAPRSGQYIQYHTVVYARAL